MSFCRLLFLPASDGLTPYEQGWQQSRVGSGHL